MFPPMSTDGVLGAASSPPTVDRPEPADLRLAKAPKARRGDCEDTRVTAIEVRDGVSNASSPIAGLETELVVDAGGMFGAEIGRMVGVNVPLIPMAHDT